jgi:ribosomal protein S30
MAKKIEAWEAEVDNGSATPTPKVKKPTPKLPPEAENDGPPKDSKGKDIQPRPYKKGGSVSSASKRADGCAIRGKTRA